MNCYQCGGKFQEKTDVLEILDPVVGKLSFEGISYYQCDKCSGLLYSAELAKAIEEAKHARLKELLNDFPIGEFITAAETASILGISRQALHKNNRINHGFIHHIKFGGANVYLKLSVLQFKKTGDGRFPLSVQGYHPSSRYVEDTVPLKLGAAYYSQPRTPQPVVLGFQDSCTTSKENVYVN